ncbi:MAG: hypothetical protein ACI4XL_08670 [Bacillus sp. (in: firmicutes)]
MISFVGYQLKSYIRSFLFIPPVVLYISWVGILYAYSNMNILGSYATSAVGLYMMMTWIAMNIFRLEETAEKHILIVQLKNRNYYLCGKWFACLAFLIPLIIIGHFYPILMGGILEPLSASEHMLSLYAHLSLGVYGILVGSFFAGTRLAEKKYIWLLTALTVTASLSYEQLAALLPVAFDWLLWLLPPLRFAYLPLKESVNGTVPSDFLASFSLSLFYTVIVGLIIQRMFMRSEEGKG